MGAVTHNKNLDLTSTTTQGFVSTRKSHYIWSCPEAFVRQALALGSSPQGRGVRSTLLSTGTAAAASAAPDGQRHRSAPSLDLESRREATLIDRDG